MSGPAVTAKWCTIEISYLREDLGRAKQRSDWGAVLHLEGRIAEAERVKRAIEESQEGKKA